MADEIRQRTAPLYNVGCKWRYKQMRYVQCESNQSSKNFSSDQSFDDDVYDMPLNLIYNNKRSKELVSKLENDSLINLERLLYCDRHNCLQPFSSWFQLQRHRSKHNKHEGKVKPYDCDWGNCRSKFKKLKNLIVHRRLHTGERPFKCEYENCNKSFRAAHSLTSHRRTHLQENVIIKHQH